MPADAARDRLLGRLARVRRERERFLAGVRDAAGDALSRPPAPGMWSTLQILEHLVRAEDSILRGLADPSARVERRRTWKDRLLYGVVLAVLRLRLPVPVVSSDMEPSGGASPEALERAWEESLRRVEAHVGCAAAADLRRAVFRHPVAGPLDLGRALRIDELHIRAHGRELRRNLALQGAAGPSPPPRSGAGGPQAAQGGPQPGR